jgi:hypothetical protein
MASTLEAERRDQLLECAEAVAKLAKHREIEPIRAHLVRHDLEYRRVLEAIVRRWTKLTPIRYDQPWRGERARSATAPRTRRALPRPRGEDDYGSD